MNAAKQALFNVQQNTIFSESIKLIAFFGTPDFDCNSPS